MANFLAAITGNDLKRGATSTYIVSVHTCVGKKKEKKPIKSRLKFRWERMRKFYMEIKNNKKM